MPKSSSSNGGSVWSRLATPGAKWEDKDEFLDVIYWGRQVLSVLMGIIWGYLGLTGAFGILSFVAANSAAVYIYSLNFNEEQEDAITGVKEGFMTAFASFLVTWIIIYTTLYF
ncbi:PREDICTED: uncharacterized protein C20orf24 homolog [Rhagoletis zephyria]|uniref:uncharacterized protein C20orf24 homolog n=1 Tax=Rhagoletis zephyria TaxID=28612 RepID=UPI000811A1B5|nr:PREDICTED: uncharacterized protein C20orf24 homolog [Rhagoletis zephyria]KAH9397083.1 hypothetical protein TYRP_003389 [Tyrophagus putrescentiae]